MSQRKDKYVMHSYKSTIGGACSVLGKTLMGAGVLPMVAGGPPSTLLAYIALAGFIIDAMGSFFGHLFSADKADVRRMMEQNESELETRFVAKPRMNGSNKKE